jgi:hypothetical protein
MVKLGIPLTRENYLYLIYMGQVPEDFGADLEDELPEPFQSE